MTMRTQAIIIKKVPIKEYDELVICYTKDAGKQTFRAKSVRRPTSKQAGHLDILNLSDFSLVYPGWTGDPKGINKISSNHPIITSAYTLNPWLNLKASLPALGAAYFLLECFDKLVFDGELDHELWNFLFKKLGKYNQLAPRTDTNWTWEIKSSHQELIKTMGYEPNTSVESLVGKPFKSLQFIKKVVG